jgi:hypothetical protein
MEATTSSKGNQMSFTEKEIQVHELEDCDLFITEGVVYQFIDFGPSASNHVSVNAVDFETDKIESLLMKRDAWVVAQRFGA